MTTDDVDRFERWRPRLEAIAYRLLGSADEAPDVVQETFLRWHAADVDHVEVPEAWLTKALTNLCLNQLTSARARRETYVGRWLPEPLLAGDPMLGPAPRSMSRTPKAAPTSTRPPPSGSSRSSSPPPPAGGPISSYACSPRT